MKSNTHTRAGFSLVELLVVIGIIGVLAGLLLSAISNVKAQAHSATCKNHLRQMGLALQMYVNDHQSKYPFYRDVSDPALNGSIGAEDTEYWWAKLQPYYAVKWSDPAYHCPGYKGLIAGVSSGKGGSTRPLGSYAYNARGVIATWTTNGIVTNSTLLGLGGKVYEKPRPGSLSRLTAEGQIVSPSDMFAIGESRWKAQGEGWQKGGFDYMQGGMIYVNKGVAAFDPARHGKNYNQLFCDGHVAAMSPWDLFDLTKTADMWNFDHKPHAEFWPR